MPTVIRSDHIFSNYLEEILSDDVQALLLRIVFAKSLIVDFLVDAKFHCRSLSLRIKWNFAMAEVCCKLKLLHLLLAEKVSVFLESECFGLFYVCRKHYCNIIWWAQSFFLVNIIAPFLWTQFASTELFVLLICRIEIIQMIGILFMSWISCAII